jgi:hypothetical protein
MPPADQLKTWCNAHGPAATSRVAKRIERFASNTKDTDTAAAARDLIELIKANTPKTAPIDVE